MWRWTIPVTILTVLGWSWPVLGHGTPIQVSVNAGRLVVSGGVPDSVGFAPFLFGEDDEDGDPFAEITLPSYGPVVLWQIPGFEINGMESESSLSLEALLRPVAGADPAESRTLWYWNAQTQMVEPTPAASALYLLARDNRSRTLAWDDETAPESLLLSDSMTAQQGFHNHGLLSFALDNDPPPPAGAYGFFARVLSDSYAASEPFLIVLNHGVTDYEQMTPAALAINAAAINVEPILGDYDGNGSVNSADYNLWRAEFGRSVPRFASPDGNGNGIVDAADYVVWRRAVTQPALVAAPAAPVPEAHLSVVLFTALIGLELLCRARRAKNN
jgi:hypothetical protein